MVTRNPGVYDGPVGRTASVRPYAPPNLLATEAGVSSVRQVVLPCHRRDLFVSRLFAVSDVQCEAGRDDLRAFTSNDDAIVLVRTGRFGRRLRGSFSLLDSTQAYLQHKGEEELIQHLRGVGHRCTVISFRSDGFPTKLRLRARLGHAEFRTTPKTDLAHRMVLAACRREGDPAELSAMLRSLVDELLSACEGALCTSRRFPAAAAARKAVDTARENMDSLITPPSLGSMAAAASVSAQQLARVFKANTGLTLGQYRGRIRVRLALERLGDGEPDLSSLAHDLGYFDHSHFSRTVARELGIPPRVVRELLSTGSAATGTPHQRSHPHG